MHLNLSFSGPTGADQIGAATGEVGAWIWARTQGGNYGASAHVTRAQARQIVNVLEGWLAETERVDPQPEQDQLMVCTAAAAGRCAARCNHSKPHKASEWCRHGCKREDGIAGARCFPAPPAPSAAQAEDIHHNATREAAGRGGEAEI